MENIFYNNLYICNVFFLNFWSVGWDVKWCPVSLGPEKLVTGYLAEILPILLKTLSNQCIQKKWQTNHINDLYPIIYLSYDFDISQYHVQIL